MQKGRLPYLLKQYLDNRITAGEWDELQLHLTNEDSSEALQTTLEMLIGQSPENADYQEADWMPLYQSILERSGQAGQPEHSGQTGQPEHSGQAGQPQGSTGMVRKIGRQWAVAAAVMLILGIGFVRYEKHKTAKAPVVAAAPLASDLLPGSNKAILTLADGTTINLDAAQNGLVGQQGDQQLIKTRNEELAYRSGDRNPEPGKSPVPGKTSVQYNLLTTPRGGQYRLQLPDGSKVWLNAATSLRYPTAFTGGERVVELRGEAYFEITPDATKPFRVTIQRGEEKESRPLQVEVLGTHFNIMDYAEEPVVNTTLLEGSIRVRKGEHSVLVKPGEQALLNKHDELKVTAADTEEAVAWKDGMFKFKDAGIETVMRQLARWYDVEIVYVNGVPRDRFQGEMYRNVNASKILKVLEASGVHFTVEGKKINLFMDKAP